MELIFWLAIFVVSLFVLIKSSDYFVDSAEKIAIFFKLSPFIIGVTVVSLGTSLPELISSIIAVLQGTSEIVIGNVVGSNIANIFLVLGFCAVIGKNLKIDYDILDIDLPLLVGSAFLLGWTILDGVFTWKDGILCLLGLIIYLMYTLQAKHPEDIIDKDIKKIQKEKKKKFEWKYVFFIFVSGVFLYLGARYTVDSIVNISQILGVGEEIIAVTAVALGTSLPELMVSFNAAKKGKPEIAVGNILGSNIYNSFAVMGIPALIGPLVIPQNIITFSLPMMLVATFLYVLMTQNKRISRWEGYTLLLFYVFFIGQSFGFF